MRDKVLGSLRSWKAVLKSEGTAGPTVPKIETHKAEQLVESYRRAFNPGISLFTMTGALTSEATAPCCACLHVEAADG